MKSLLSSRSMSSVPGVLRSRSAGTSVLLNVWIGNAAALGQERAAGFGGFSAVVPATQHVMPLGAS